MTPSLLDMLSPIISSSFTHPYTAESLQISQSAVSSLESHSILPERLGQKLSSLEIEGSEDLSNCNIESKSMSVSPTVSTACSENNDNLPLNVTESENPQSKIFACLQSSSGESSRPSSNIACDPEFDNKSAVSQSSISSDSSSVSSSDSSLLGHYYKRVSGQGQVRESSSSVTEASKQSAPSLVLHYSNCS